MKIFPALLLATAITGLADVPIIRSVKVEVVARQSGDPAGESPSFTPAHVLTGDAVRVLDDHTVRHTIDQLPGAYEWSIPAADQNWIRINIHLAEGIGSRPYNVAILGHPVSNSGTYFLFDQTSDHVEFAMLYESGMFFSSPDFINFHIMPDLSFPILWQDNFVSLGFIGLPAESIPEPSMPVLLALGTATILNRRK